MSILLLGGNGYIGSKLYSHLSKSFNVESVDLCLFGKNLGYSRRVDYSSIDIGDYQTIICLAGHSSVQMCAASPVNSWNNNVDNFFKLCQELKSGQKLIYASSASVYGNKQKTSSEDSPINFNTVYDYDLQKITIDLIANRHINQGKNIVGLRFGTVNGSAPNTRGELMLNSMVKSAIENGVVVAKNIGVRRAILGINDLVDAVHSTMVGDIPPGQYNLSSFNSTVGHMANHVAERVGAKLEVLPADAASYDFELDTTKFTSTANFKFKETTTLIIEDLINNYGSICFDIRDNDRFYGK